MASDVNHRAAVALARLSLNQVIWPDTCQCPACRDGILHSAGCAVHRAPAEPVGPCDCGALAKAERRYVTWAVQVVCTRLAGLQTELRSWWWRVCR